MAKTIRRNFPVQGMGCAACVARVQGTIRSLEGVQDCNVSLASNTAQVDYNPQTVTAVDIRKAVQEAGYDLIVVDGDDSDDEADSEADSEAERLQEDYLRSLTKDMWVALVLALLVMLLGMGFGDFPGKGYVLWALATPVVSWCGRRFISTAWKQARHGTAGMDTLVSLSILISYFFSIFNLLFPGVWTSRGLMPHLYFESSTMIVAFILIGRVLEEKAKHSTGAAIRGLAGLQPKSVRLNPGDLYTVNPGERIPADGEVVSGESHVDESMLTGEPVPNLKTPGSKVFTGTMNQRGSFVMKAEKVGKDTMLSSIIRMVKDAQGSKAKIQNTVDKVAAVFVPVIIGISILTLLCWIFLAPSDGVTMGLLAMVTVLVIACPCSLGLATPTALTVGIGNCARKGILIKDADSLQVAKDIDTVVFDKTGTITKELSADIIPTADMEFVDEVKETSAEAMAQLRKMGLDVFMLSGDNPERAGRVASKVGIGNVISGVLPDSKHEHIQRLQAEGRKVAMVGDGINDSPALALADLSVAMGNGTDIAMNSSMVTIVGSDLKAVPALIKMSRRTSKVIRENLFWAFIYNILAVPVAAGILYPVNGFLLNLMVAAACMALSSVCVVANSLRLRKN